MGTARIALDGRIIGADAKLCEMLGYRGAELLERRIHDLRHADDVEIATHRFRAVIEGAMSSSATEEQCVRSDGSLIRVAVMRTLARDAAGAPRHVVEVLVQMKHRQRADDALERALAGERAARVRVELAEARLSRLQVVTSELSRALTVAEVAGVMLKHGLSAFYADAGYMAAAAEDGMIDVILAPGYPADVVDKHRRFPVSAPVPAAECIRTGRLLVFESPEAMSAAGFALASVSWARTWVCVPMIVGARVLGALGLTYLDTCRITQEDRDFMMMFAQQSAQAMERARLYDVERRGRRLREEALAIAAHDLRNPLSSILVSAALLDKTADGSEAGRRVRARAQAIQRNAERATELLRELLDAATIEARSLKLEIGRCDLNALLAEIVEMFAPIADQKSIRLSASPLEGPVEIACDRSRLLQVLSNLAGNALKFTPEGGEIVVRAEREDAVVRVSVSDTGAGINPEDLPHLFDRYWQARATRRSGAGLGLYIVKGIVEAHGGQMSVDTRLGVGTTISFTLAAAAPGA